MEAAGLGLTRIIVSAVLGGVLGLFIYLYTTLFLQPRRLQSKLRRQGIRGPPPSFLFGNIAEMKKIQLHAHSTAAKDHDSIAHDWPFTLFSYIHQWRNQYGTLWSLNLFSALNYFILFTSLLFLDKLFCEFEGRSYYKLILDFPLSYKTRNSSDGLFSHCDFS